MGLKHRRSVVISRSAQQSIREIFDYIEQRESLSVAHKVRQAILDRCKELGDFAGYSRERYLEALEGDYRSVAIWDYSIVYRVSDTEIRILTVIHSSRHPDSRKDFEEE